MKALVLTACNEFTVREVPAPIPGPGEVLIRVRACGICGSDVHGMDGSSGRRQPPIIMGHEAAGEVAGLGAGVSGLQAGDRVTFDSTIYCGRCLFCRAGRFNLCEDRRVAGVACDEYRQNGAFAEYITVPQHIIYPLPETLRFEQAAMAEALSIAVHAVARTPVRLNDAAVVVGAGMIGLLVVQALRVAGCGTIIAVDIDPVRLKLAGKLGADTVLRSDEEDVAAAVAAHTNGHGANLAFEVVGMTPTVQLALRCLRKGGTLALVGNVTPVVELPLQAAVTREIAMLGSCASCGEYPACLEMIARGRIDVDALISAVAPLADGADWFRRLAAREPGLMKVILVP